MSSTVIMDLQQTLSSEEQRKVDELLEKMKDYPEINFQKDEYFLTKYLRCCDWNVDGALKKIIDTYKFKHGHTEWFASKKVSEYKEILNHHVRYILEDYDKNGRRIFVYKLSNTHSSLTPQACTELDDLWLSCILAEPKSQINGLSIIIDCIDLPIYLWKWLKPSYIKIASYKADLLGVRNMDVHVVNTSPLFDKFLTIIKPFISKEIKEKIHFHKKDWSSLHAYLGKNCLPEEYGGPPGKVVDYQKCYKYLYDREDFIYQTRQYGVIDK